MKTHITYPFLLILLIFSIKDLKSQSVFHTWPTLDIQGEIFDVVVDIRKDSPTYGQWLGEVLSAGNKKQLWIPPGFAHGFLTLSETAEILYKTTDFYAPEFERCIIWNDEEIGIEWPIHNTPFLSKKDQDGVSLLDVISFT